MEIVKKCEWCHKTFIGQMVTARFCSSKCCDQAYRYKRKVQSGKYTPADSNIDLSTLSRRVDAQRQQSFWVFAEVQSTTILRYKN